jgi:poly(hydroxyalkanoate) depolymerase family esterase
MLRARAGRAALAVLLLVVVVGTADAQKRAAPVGTFGRGTLEGRAYRVWLPSRPAPERPLIVALHGCWQTPEDFALGARLNEAAEARGLVVVYPAQTRSANPYRCWNWFDPTEQTASGYEAAQILAIARRVQAERALREPRVVVIGFSAGGWMAVNLACAAPEMVGGVGSVAGGPYRCARTPEAAIQCMRGTVRDGAAAAAAACLAAASQAPRPRVSLWQGAADTVVNPANLILLEGMFARVLGSSAGLTSTDHGAIHSLYRDQRGERVLETWLVQGLGHAWSGGDPRGTHAWSLGPPMTDLMLDFLVGPR